MINLKFHSRRKSYHTPALVKKEEPMGEIMKEARRRDDIIIKMARECAYKSGDIVTPYCKEEQEKWGEEIVVEHIVSSYAAYGKEPWPKSDTPKIVQAYSKDKDTRFHCTPGFLVRSEKTV